MAHCFEEEADLAGAQVDEVSADNAHIVTETTLALAIEDLEECEDEH